LHHHRHGRQHGPSSRPGLCSGAALVVGCDLNVDAAEATVAAARAPGGTMVSLQPCQLSKPADCQALADLAVRSFGRIDVLFNNAAMPHFNWLEDITDQEWDQNRRDEVDLVFYLTRAAWPHLKASRGVVVNTASLNALLSFKTLGSVARTTAKAGIIAMTRQLAMEGRENGIRANSISPGLIETNQTRAQLQDPEWAAAMLGKTLLGRLGRPEEVANVALFLASDESAYVTDGRTSSSCFMRMPNTTSQSSDAASGVSRFSK
jgi:NAD(P)-dependent dehydrogenase (short-subunit alcohol dehydrogenase family)